MISTIKDGIIPSILKRNSSYYRIEITDPEYIITEFEIHTNKNKKIEKLIITKGNHPNCDPKTKIFCIPDFLKNQELDDRITLSVIKDLFLIWNFDSAYSQPWTSFEYLDGKPL